MAKGATTAEEKQLAADARKSFDQIIALYEGKLRQHKTGRPAMAGRPVCCRAVEVLYPTRVLSYVSHHGTFVHLWDILAIIIIPSRT